MTDASPASHAASPAAIAQAQLNAYNARDLDALLSTYAPDAEQFTLEGECLARGHAQIRERFAARFSEPDLHAQLVSRMVMGDIVVDLETIIRNFPEGRGALEMLCIYVIRNGRIQRATFAAGSKTLF